MQEKRRNTEKNTEELAETGKPQNTYAQLRISIMQINIDYKEDIKKLYSEILDLKFKLRNARSKYNKLKKRENAEILKQHHEIQKKRTKT